MYKGGEGEMHNGGTQKRTKGGTDKRTIFGTDRQTHRGAYRCGAHIDKGENRIGAGQKMEWVWHPWCKGTKKISILSCYETFSL